MHVILSPIASTKTTQVSLSGLTLTVDGVDIDLSIIPEGGQAEADENSPLIGIVTRDKVTVRYEYDMMLAEENQSTDWDDYTFDITEGEVPCPIKWKPVAEEIEDDI